jgi:Pyruvate/2-oxoacid:ferredoxin oxidoreductase delta subunit
MIPRFVQISFFSGTGNSRFVSQTIKKIAQEKDLPCSLLDLGKEDRKRIAKPDAETLLGFISPTHGFNYPPLMIHYLLRYPRGKNEVFLMNTRAGMKIGNFFLPGLSGIALLLAAFILSAKGYRIIGMRSIDLPSNWISIHPGLREKVMRSIYLRCEIKIRKFATGIFSGKRNFRALLDLPVDLAIAPVALGYYFLGRFAIAKSFYATSNCNNCNLCITGCPVQAIKIVDHRPYWTFNCESCMKCMNICPQRAIETAHGFFFGILYLSNFIQSLWFWGIWQNWLGPSATEGFSNFIVLLINSAVSLLFYLAGYRLIHYLMRFKQVDFLMRYTSLTFFHFWRRFKIPTEFKKS